MSNRFNHRRDRHCNRGADTRPLPARVETEVFMYDLVDPRLARPITSIDPGARFLIGAYDRPNTLYLSESLDSGVSFLVLYRC